MTSTQISEREILELLDDRGLEQAHHYLDDLEGDEHWFTEFLLKRFAVGDSISGMCRHLDLTRDSFLWRVRMSIRRITDPMLPWCEQQEWLMEREDLRGLFFYHFVKGKTIEECTKLLGKGRSQLNNDRRMIVHRWEGYRMAYEDIVKMLHATGLTSPVHDFKGKPRGKKCHKQQPCGA